MSGSRRCRTTSPSSSHDRPGLLLLDLAVPAVLYYGLRFAGVSELTALLVGAAPTMASAITSSLRRRRTNLLGMTVILSLLASALLAVLGGGVRLLLVRGAWLSLPFAGVNLWSLRHPQPLCFTVTRAMLPRRAPVMDRLWEQDARFRRAWRLITIGWGITAIVDAIVRIVVSYTLPVDVVPGVDTTITVVSALVMQVPTHLLLRRSGTWHLVFSPRVPGRA